MKPSGDSKNSGIKSPAMRKLARVKCAKSATAAAASRSKGDASEAAMNSSGAVEAAGAEAAPADTLRLPKTLSSFTESVTSTLKGTLRKKKDSAANKGLSIMNTWREMDAATTTISRLPPPMPPVAPAPRLRRANSSTMTIGGRGTQRKMMLTLDELYVEIMYCILHMIGSDAEREEQSALVAHLREAFHMCDDKHAQLHDIASMREEPYLKANLEIVEARSLVGKDMSGSSDPFCTCYLTTNPISRFNTSYKARTLSPKWNEEFILDVNRIDEDALRIDVWDFNWDENVTDKFRKINEIKDARGIRKFIKETLHASAGKTTHGLIGSAEIPLREVPSSGLEKWIPLEKPETKTKGMIWKPPIGGGGNGGTAGGAGGRGEVFIRLLLSTEKDQTLTAQEHKHLLKILFANELQKSQCAPFTWNGEFSKEAVVILAQHANQGKLTGAETALARWLVYVHTHCDLPLDYRAFHPILEKLKYAMENNLLHQEDEAKFLETAVIFAHHAAEFLRNHRTYIANDEDMLVQLEYILRNLKMVSESSEGRALPQNVGGRYDASEERHLARLVTAGSMKERVEEAIEESMMHWHAHIMDSVPLETARNQRLRSVIQLVNVLATDLRQGCEAASRLVADIMPEVGYVRQGFAVYEKEVTHEARDMVVSTCERLRPIVYSQAAEEEEGGDDHEDIERAAIAETINVGTSLFELYLSLQHMASIGHDVYRESPPSDPSEFMDNHTWFNKGVTRWLDIALYKAMQRITKAVELDDLQPVDDMVKHSSSAVDIRTVLLQIKTFWRQLAWPDAEGAYAYLSKILDDICKMSIFYADQMCRKVIDCQREQQEEHKRKSLHLQNGSVPPVPNQRRVKQHHQQSRFDVTPSICLAINNIDYVLEFIKPFVTEELGTEETLEKLERTSGRVVAASCRRTLSTLIVNTVENVENKILEVLDVIGERMAPVIQKFLFEGSSLIGCGRNMDSLIGYLDKNMLLLKEKLNEANFEKVLSIIWESSAKSLSDTIHVSIERQKSPGYFRTLHDILKVLINFFYGDKIPQDETLMKMKGLLQLYAADSGELISRYFWERHLEQRALQQAGFSRTNSNSNNNSNNNNNHNSNVNVNPPNLGSITVRCQMLNEHLRVEVLNARNLKPPDLQAVRLAEKRNSGRGFGGNNYLSNHNNNNNNNNNSNNRALYRSSRNLDWVKSKWNSIKSNLHEASIQLHTASSAGQCDPYVSVRLVPRQRFPFSPKFKTRPQRRTLFPLFDETFDFVLEGGVRSRIQGTYLLLVVKDRGIMGNGIFLGEALLPLEDIAVTDMNKNLADLPQLLLPLTKPSEHDSDIMLALESRNFDRTASEFLSRERKKLV